jgi:hypothetical protein
MKTLLLAGESACPTLAAVGQALSIACQPASSTESVPLEHFCDKPRHRFPLLIDHIPDGIPDILIVP